MFGNEVSFRVESPGGIRRTGYWADALLLLVVVVACDAGYFSELDGVIAAFVVLVLRFELLPYLVIELAGFQDDRGFDSIWWYGAVVAFGVIAFARHAPEIIRDVRRQSLRFRALLAVGVIAVIYAVSSSYFQESFGIHLQAKAREPIIVGALALAMIGFGAACWTGMRDDRRAGFRLRLVFWYVMINGVFVSIARLLFGYKLFLSPRGVAEMDVQQLIDNTPLGFPRLSGTYLTPIGFALYLILILLLIHVLDGKRKLRFSFGVGYTFFGILLSAMSLSKGIAIYFALSSAAFVAIRKRVLIPGILIVLIAVTLTIYFLGADALLESFRVQSGTSTHSYRALAWLAVIHRFSALDWIFGTGYGYWPVFFRRNFGWTLSDPHSYILSIPGTYGFIGVVFYMLLAAFLAERALATKEFLRWVVIALIAMFFIADAVSIPYVIGNTPITLIIWVILFGVASVGEPRELRYKAFSGEENAPGDLSGAAPAK